MGGIMLQELAETLDTLENDDEIRCVVVTSSSPRVFSAGADLKERATMTMEEAAAFVTRLRNTMQRLSRLPMPTIAAIEGVAVGGGLELALAADLRIAGMNAKFGLPETGLAIIPGAGGTQRLSRLIGVARAKELIFTARRIDASTALDYGLVQHVVESRQADSKAIE
jgi:methylglutaconyl-CoA hydratase